MPPFSEIPPDVLGNGANLAFKVGDALAEAE
jgi:hypothetical protein